MVSEGPEGKGKGEEEPAYGKEETEAPVRGKETEEEQVSEAEEGKE